MKKVTITLLLSILLFGTAASHPSSFYFKHYDNTSGLSQNTVMSIFQDSKGFIWMGTKNGLNRFDGHDFKTYQRGDSVNELKNSMIFCMAEDRNKMIWLGTDQGISLYNPITENFSSLNLQTDQQEEIEGYVFKIFIDNRSRAWILAGKGLFLADGTEDKLYCLNKKFPTHSSARPCALFVEQDHTAYVGLNDASVWKYDINSDTATFLSNLGSIPTDICNYKEGRILVGTQNKGLFSINKETGTSEELQIDNKLSSNMYVRDIEQISETEYWIGTESGIYIIKDETVQHVTHEKFNNLSLSDNAIYAIFKDKEGGIWIGSYFGGVDYIPKPYSSFENFYPIAYKNSISGYRVREFVSDKQGNLWIATEDNGLNYYNTRTGVFTHVSQDTTPLDISFTNIQCLHLSDDKLWVGTFSKGIDVLDLKTGKRRHYEKSDKPHSVQNNDIFAIFTDSRNTTWIGSTSQTYMYVPEIDGFRTFQPLDGIFISDIWEDHNGYIWFATANAGIIRYNPGNEELKRFRYNKNDAHSLCYDRITSIFEDSQQRLWFASEDGGFCRYNEQDETFTRITIKEGLPSNVVFKILEDDNRHFWLSTNNGIAKFDPEIMAVEALYNLHNGLQSKQFNYNSGIKTEDGTLYFGSINGFVKFNPKTFRTNTNRYSVVLTGFYIFNREVKADSTGKIMDKAIPYADAIHLRYDQATFSLSFSALNYSTEDNGKYAYLLEGLNNQWNYTDNATPISYNSIPPGNYTFRIKYSKDGYEWSHEDTHIHIQIVPPLWQTRWAYMLYSILLISMLYMIMKYYARKKRKQVEEKLEHQEQMKKEEIYKAKIEFFTSIAHEIRTPITLIKAPLDYILNSRPNEHEVKENLVTMERNTDRLLVLVNQLLDFRKIESKAFTLSLKVRNINTLVTNTYNRFVPTARQKHLEMTLECPQPAIMAYVDEEAITKVCSNLFNNAIKYTSTYIKVIVRENKELHYFQITVRNDGAPIPVDLRQSIFEAFFQIKDASQPVQPGSGIGLTLANSLVQLHNGKLFLDEEAADTSFIVQVPTNLPADVQPEPLDGAIEEVTAESDISSLPVSEVAGSAKENLLIVEDNEELRAFLNNQLGRYYQVITTTNGAEAMEALNKHIVNLIVSDVMMPVMDGLSLCKSIKANIETCHIPVILLTAKTTLSNKIEGLKYGADAYIEKPFAMPHLLVQINNLLENRMKLRQNFANNPYIATNSMAQNKADEDFLNKLTEIIRQNLDDENFNIDNLAAEMNMSRTSLHRKIKGITEFTPGDFIRIIRLKRAAELLMEGEYRINEICMLVGIRSLSYFSKSFQKQFGVLPKDFAKSQGHHSQQSE